MIDFEIHLNVDDVILMLFVDDIDDVNVMDLDYVELVLMVMNMNNLMIVMEQKDSLKNLHHHLNQLLN